jgi:hypothetical protein
VLRLHNNEIISFPPAFEEYSFVRHLLFVSIDNNPLDKYVRKRKKQNKTPINSLLLIVCSKKGVEPNSNARRRVGVFPGGFPELFSQVRRASMVGVWRRFDSPNSQFVDGRKRVKRSNREKKRKHRK